MVRSLVTVWSFSKELDWESAEAVQGEFSEELVVDIVVVAKDIPVA